MSSRLERRRAEKEIAAPRARERARPQIVVAIEPAALLLGDTRRTASARYRPRASKENHQREDGARAEDERSGPVLEAIGERGRVDGENR
jgi:hypothetical protein